MNTATETESYSLSLEQGDISSSGDTESTRKVRSSGYTDIHKCSLKAIIEATTSREKTINIRFIGYGSTDPSDIIYEATGNTPREINLTNYGSKIKYFRVVFKYTDSSIIDPSELSSTAVEVEFVSPWEVYDNELTHLDLPEKLDGAYIVRPYLSLWWDIIDGKLAHFELPEEIDGAYITEPYLPFWWYVDDEKLTREPLPDEIYQGAFCNCTELKTVVIPASVKYIGEYAFYNTALTAVTIASDCVYFPTSFPPRCIIQYYLD